MTIHFPDKQICKNSNGALRLLGVQIEVDGEEGGVSDEFNTNIGQRLRFVLTS